MSDFREKTRARGQCGKACILASFVLLTVAPILILGLVARYYLSLAVIGKTSQYSMAILGQSVESIQLKLSEYEDKSVRLFVNKEFDSLLTGYIEDGLESHRSGGALEAYFSECMRDNRDISALIFVFDADKQRSIVVAGDEDVSFADLPNNFIAGSAYENTVKADGGIVWSSPILIGGGHFLIMSRYVKAIKTGEPFGVLAAAIDERRIDRLANTGVYGRAYAAPGELQNYTIVMDGRGGIVSTPFKEDIGRNIAEIVRDVRPLSALLARGTARASGASAVQGSYITEVDREEVLVAYASIGSKIGAGGKSGWHLLHLTFISPCYSGIRNVALLTTALCLGFGALAALFAFYAIPLIDQTRHGAGRPEPTN